MSFKSTLLSILLFFPIFGFSQNIKPELLGQFKSLLNAKGVSEDELKQNLIQKGIQVETMTEADALANRPIIEQSINELEQKNKAKKTPEVFINPETKISTATDLPVTVVPKVEQPAVIETTSNPTKIYGHSIFTDKSLEFARLSKDASPPDSYILAPGDIINLIIFGKSQADLQFEISNLGFIKPTQMPKIFLSGLTLKQAKILLANRFSTYYVFNNDQFALTLNTSRTLNVNIFGEVVKPASYTTSALNTAINVLSASGGPSDLGSVRSIQIIRGNIRKLLDIYAFMRDPIVKYDFFLQNNDIIYVPPAEIVVEVEGGVNRPMQYEMKKNETIKDLISFAGGFKKDAYTDLVQIERFENNQVVLKDYPLNEILENKIFITFLNGDKIRFKSISSPLKTYVKINGAIFYPGNYAINSTKTIKSLIEKAKLSPEAKTDQIFLFRKKLDQSVKVISIALQEIILGKIQDIPLENEDEITVFEQARYVEKFKIKVVGQVQNPFEKLFKYGEGLTVQEAVALAGGLNTNALNTAFVYRTNPFQSTKTTYIPVNVNETFLLVSGDQLVILDKNLFSQESSINIVGEVNKSLQLRYDPSLKLSNLLQLAGGITRAADLNRIDVFRLNFSSSESPKKSLITLKIDENFNIVSGPFDFQLSPFDYIVIRKIEDFRLNESVQVSGEVKYPGHYILQKNKYHFSDLIKDAGGISNVADLMNIRLTRYIDSSGIIVFDAQKALNHKGQFNYDPILKENDFIEIPKINALIQIEINATKYVLGNNQKLLQIIYQGKHSAKWYIKHFAGGFAKNADKSSILIIRNNGIASSTKKIFWVFKKYPKVHYGDRILVSNQIKVPSDKKDDKPVDWDKMFAKIISMGTLLALIANATK